MARPLSDPRNTESDNSSNWKGIGKAIRQALN